MGNEPYTIIMVINAGNHWEVHVLLQDDRGTHDVVRSVILRIVFEITEIVVSALVVVLSDPIDTVVISDESSHGVAIDPEQVLNFYSKIYRAVLYHGLIDFHPDKSFVTA